MKKLLIIISILAIICQKPVFASGGTTIYVSPNGDDANSGTIEAPIKTVDRAYTMIKNARTNNVTVLFDDGEFFVEKPLEFDSDILKDKALEISTYGDGETVFNAGKVIEGWVETDEGYWKAPVEEDTFFRTLYFNNKKGIRARYPNVDEYLTIASITENRIGVEASAVEGIENYENRLELGIKYEWMTKFFRVTELRQNGENLEAVINETEWNSYKKVPQGANFGTKSVYWFENALEFLDSPGEWYLDELSNVVYYYPYPYQKIEDTVISHGNAENIFKFTGTTDSHIKNVRIDGITFTGTDWTYPSFNGFVDIQANSIAPADLVKNKDTQYRHDMKKQKLQGAIHAFYTDDIVIENCIFEGISANAIVFEEGGKNITVSGNVFFDIGSTGVEVGGDYYKAKNPDMYHQNVVIDNNFLSDIANYYYGGVGIMTYYIDGLNITNNHIKDCSYTGISANWGWGKSEAVEYARNYKICNNHVENFMSRLRDGGGIYTPCVASGENIIDGNYVIGNATNFDPKSGSSGIYHDGSSSNWTDTNNVLEDLRPFSLQAIAGQETSNITMRDNHHNQTLFWDAKLKNIVSENNTYYPTNNFNEVAQEIIDNAGLKTKELEKNVAQAYIGKNFYEKIVPGQDMVFELTIKNYQEEADIYIEPEMPDGVEYVGERILHMSENEERDILVSINTEVSIPEGFYLIPINIYGGDKLFTRTFCSFLVEDKYNIIIDIHDEGYKKLGGKFSASGLQGYTATSDYGYEAGAKVSWVPQIPEPGEYTVRLWIMKHDTSDDKAQIDVKHADGIYTTTLDFTKLPNGWYEIGTFRFDQDGYVSNTLINTDAFLRASAAAFTKECTDEQKEIIAIENKISKLAADVVYMDGKDYCFVNGFKQRLEKPFDKNDENAVAVTPRVLASLIRGITIEKGNEIHVIKGCVGFKFKKGEAYYERNNERVELKKPIDDNYTIPATQIFEEFGYKIKTYSNGLTTVSTYDIELDEKKLSEGLSAFIE